MADNAKEVASTPQPAQSSDDNRRRTRSQTRNGGISTPPAPVAEARGRKRGASQGSGSGKRGRKAAEPNNVDQVKETKAPDTPPKETESPHSKKVEIKDLSDAKTSEQLNTNDKPTEEKEPDVEMKTEEAESAEESAPNKEQQNEESCKVVKEKEPEEKDCDSPKRGAAEETKLTESSDKEVDKSDVKKDTPSNSQASDEICPIAEKAKATKEVTTTEAQEPEKQAEESDASSKSIKATSALKDVPADKLKPSDNGPEIEIASEQTKNDTANDAADVCKITSNSKDNASTESEVKSGAQIQESGDSKLDTALKESVIKTDEPKAVEKTNSATPV